jgi:hypothetical protein
VQRHHQIIWIGEIKHNPTALIQHIGLDIIIAQRINPGLPKIPLGIDPALQGQSLLIQYTIRRSRPQTARATHCIDPRIGDQPDQDGWPNHRAQKFFNPDHNTVPQTPAIMRIS